MLYDTGFSKSIKDLALMDKSAIIMSLMDYHLMVKVKAQMDQFKEGLTVLGFLQVLVSAPREWENYFLAQGKKLTAGY